MFSHSDKLLCINQAPFSCKVPTMLTPAQIKPKPFQRRQNPPPPPHTHTHTQPHPGTRPDCLASYRRLEWSGEVTASRQEPRWQCGWMKVAMSETVPAQVTVVQSLCHSLLVALSAQPSTALRVSFRAWVVGRCGVGGSASDPKPPLEGFCAYWRLSARLQWFSS